jgi:predicted short-subunit dehydrogenase-like oxidoreductase (DUF2520 family)
MLSRCMARTISIVGAGRVGRTLGKRLREVGWRIGTVVTRSSATARAAVLAIGGGSPHARLTRKVLDADIILVTTPDDALAPLAAMLARIGGKACHGKVVLHTSGALDRSVLAPLSRFGAATGSLHPMQTFSGRAAPKLKGVIFTIEGDPHARQAAQQIARQLGGVPVTINGASKPAYHAAAVLVAGHALGLVEAATQILMRAGFTRRRATAALLSLVRQMLDNFERLGPQAAWTGPVARGDFAVVAKHAKALQKYPREFRATYTALSLLAGRVLSKSPSATIQHLKHALKKSGGGPI